MSCFCPFCPFSPGKLAVDFPDNTRHVAPCSTHCWQCICRTSGMELGQRSRLCKMRTAPRPSNAPLQQRRRSATTCCRLGISHLQLCRQCHQHPSVPRPQHQVALVVLEAEVVLVVAAAMALLLLDLLLLDAPPPVLLCQHRLCHQQHQFCQAKLLFHPQMENRSSKTLTDL